MITLNKDLFIYILFIMIVIGSIERLVLGLLNYPVRDRYGISDIDIAIIWLISCLIVLLL